MKTSTRLSALLLILCLIMSMVVPAVYAESATSTTTVTYDFNLTKTQEGITSIAGNSLISSKTGYGENGTLTLGEFVSSQTVDYYDDDDTDDYKKVLNWCYTYGNTTYDKNASFKLESLYCNGNTSDSWIAFTFENPGANNEWTFSVNHRICNYTGESRIYIIPANTTADEIPTLIKDGEQANCYIGKFSGTNSSYDVNNAISTSTSNLGTWPSKDADEYMIVFQSKGRTHLYVSQLIMTSTQDNDNSTISAMKEAPINTQVTLNADLTLLDAVDTEAGIIVDANVTMDMAGKNLTAKSVNTAAPGAKVIDSADGVGLLKATLTADGDNGGYLPLYDTDGYRLYKTSYASLGRRTVGEAKQFWSELTFTNKAAYALIAGGETGVAVKAAWSWNDTAIDDVVFADNVVTQWATAMNSNQKYGFYLSVTGFPTAGGTLKVTPKIESAGVVIEAATLSYTHAAA